MILIRMNSVIYEEKTSFMDELYETSNAKYGNENKRMNLITEHSLQKVENR